MSARSRSPTMVVASMESSNRRASPAESTGVFPLRITTFGPFTDALVPPNDPEVLAAAIAAALDDPARTEERARLLRERVFLHFSQRAMVDGVLQGYRDAFAEH